MFSKTCIVITRLQWLVASHTVGRPIVVMWFYYSKLLMQSITSPRPVRGIIHLANGAAAVICARLDSTLIASYATQRALSFHSSDGDGTGRPGWFAGPRTESLERRQFLADSVATLDCMTREYSWSLCPGTYRWCWWGLSNSRQNRTAAASHCLIIDLAKQLLVPSDWSAAATDSFSKLSLCNILSINVLPIQCYITYTTLLHNNQYITFWQIL